MALSWSAPVSRKGRWSTFFSLVLILLLRNSNAAQVGGKPEKSNLTISYAQPSGAFTPLWVAYEEGLFKKYGLDPSLKLLNVQVATQALVAGEIDVASVGPDFVNARLRGAPVKYIGGMLQQFVF